MTENSNLEECEQIEKPSLSESIEDLIGAIDSQAKPYHQFQKTEFGEQIAAKLSKQGLKRSQSYIITLKEEDKV